MTSWRATSRSRSDCGSRPRVKEGERYRVGLSAIEVDAIELLPFAAVTREDADELKPLHHEIRLDSSNYSRRRLIVRASLRDRCSDGVCDSRCASARVLSHRVEPCALRGERRRSASLARSEVDQRRRAAQDEHPEHEHTDRCPQ